MPWRITTADGKEHHCESFMSSAVKPLRVRLESVEPRVYKALPNAREFTVEWVDDEAL